MFRFSRCSLPEISPQRPLRGRRQMKTRGDEIRGAGEDKRGGRIILTTVVGKIIKE